MAARAQDLTSTDEPSITSGLVDDVEGFQMPSHGNLQSWADQGVFLLNATLTVRKGERTLIATLVPPPAGWLSSWLAGYPIGQLDIQLGRWLSDAMCASGG